MRNLLMASIALTFVGCTFVSRPPVTRPQPTQLQTREFQTREYDTNDVKLVLKAVLNVLQDDGFVVKNAVPDLGLLTAAKEVNLSGAQQQTTANRSDDYWMEVIMLALGGNSNRNRATTPRDRDREREIRTAAFKSVEVSVNVSELGKRCKVRANFQAKILDNKGDPMSVQAVNDPKFYQDFFVKVDKGIFLQKQGF
ncbi:MAG: hypothetical protein FGM24_00445 [Candidatus Kapabacteria bacterium]|nr:hypothetical protein [Candidatus Kapabacteria bacterium]